MDYAGEPQERAHPVDQTLGRTHGQDSDLTGHEPAHVASVEAVRLVARALCQEQPRRPLTSDHRLAGETPLVEQVAPVSVDHLPLPGPRRSGRWGLHHADVHQVPDQPPEGPGGRPGRSVVCVKVPEELLHHLGAELARQQPSLLQEPTQPSDQVHVPSRRGRRVPQRLQLAGDAGRQRRQRSLDHHGLLLSRTPEGRSVAVRRRPRLCGPRQAVTPVLQATNAALPRSTPHIRGRRI